MKILVAELLSAYRMSLVAVTKPSRNFRLTKLTLVPKTKLKPIDGDNMMNKRQMRMRPSGRVLHVIAAAAAMVVASGVQAVEIETDNPDVKARADLTLRYNWARRMEAQDSRLMNFATTDEGNAKFKKGDTVTNRVDALGELDINYKGDFGVRVSAATWYDKAYSDRSVSSTAPGGYSTSYNNNQYSSEVNRFVHGPSGEFLDAFVWKNFDLGDAPTNVKLGRHTVVWGEGLLIGAHAISNGQSPIDGVKAVSSPGIETKEVFLPINQLTFKSQVTDKLSIAGQYALEWRPTRVPYAGTYLMGADNAPGVDRFALAPGFNLANTQAKTSGDKNWGLSARLDVDSIDATLGVYYREYNDTNPETGIAMDMVARTYKFVYPEATKVVGVSISKPIGPVSVGAELSYRKGSHLNSTGGYTTTSTGATGDTIHAVVNGVYLLPKSALWDTGSLIGELAYSQLDKITANESLYRGVGYASCKIATGATGAGGPGNITDTCSTKDYWGVAVRFTPQYLGIMPSWDLSVPVAINYGLKGTAATGGGGFEGLLTWSVGLGATYANKHDFSLIYADASVPTKYNTAGTAAVGGNALNSSVGATDRGRLLFTYKTSF